MDFTKSLRDSKRITTQTIFYQIFLKKANAFAVIVKKSTFYKKRRKNYVKK